MRNEAIHENGGVVSPKVYPFHLNPIALRTAKTLLSAIGLILNIHSLPVLLQSLNEDFLSDVIIFCYI